MVRYRVNSTCNNTSNRMALSTNSHKSTSVTIARILVVVRKELSMAQRKSEPTAIDEIVHLIAPLRSIEHDHVVHRLTERWGMPDQRQPWDRDKVVAEDRRDKVAQVEHRVTALAETLISDEHDELLEELKLVWLRRALDEAEESKKRHGTIPAEEVFAELRQRAEERLRKSQQ